MPRDGSNIYSQPFPDVAPGTTVESTVYNGFTHDVEIDLNTPRPIIAGGTGANNAYDARQNLDAEVAGTQVTNYDSHVFEAGSFWSADSATAAPAVRFYAGICYMYGDPSYITIEARDVNSGVAWVRQKISGVWGAWVEQSAGVADLDARYVNVAGDTMTGPLSNYGYNVANYSWGVDSSSAYRSTIGNDANGTPYLAFLAAPGAGLTFSNGVQPSSIIKSSAGGFSFHTLSANSTNVAPPIIATLSSTGALDLLSTGISTSPTTGALIVAGGVGVGGAIHTPTPAAGTSTTQVATTEFVTSSTIRYDAAQALTEAQKLQARTNIYAAPLDALAYNGMQLNGNFEVAQEQSFSGTNGAFIADQWQLQWAGAMNPAVGTQAAPVFGHSTWLAVQFSTPQAVLGAGDYVVVTQAIEGYRTSRLSWGPTGGARPITIAFWSSHTATGTYYVAVRNGNGTRSYLAPYTQATAGWQYNVLTIPGDTTGTWQIGNLAGITVTFTFAAGTTYTGIASAWQNGNFFAGPGQVNGAGTASTLSITGVVVLPGTEAPIAANSSLIIRPYDQELVMCQRYWTRLDDYIVDAGTQIFSTVLPVKMRATPTITGNAVGFAASGFTNFQSGYLSAASRSTARVDFNARI